MFCFKSLFSFRNFWLSFLKQTLAATLFFQCNFTRKKGSSWANVSCHAFISVYFLLVVVAYNLVWQFLIGLFRHGTGSMLKLYKLHHTFSLYTNISWDQTSKLYSTRLSFLIFFLISRGVPEDIYAKYYLIKH